MLRLVVTRNRHGNYEYLATNELTADLARVVARKQSRWNVETIFRDTKQSAGLGACQCWTDAAMVRHVALVLVAFVVLQQLRVDPSEPSPRSSSAGNWPSSVRASYHPHPSTPALLTSAQCDEQLRLEEMRRIDRQAAAASTGRC
jgi:hypothetical protein